MTDSDDTSKSNKSPVNYSESTNTRLQASIAYQYRFDENEIIAGRYRVVEPLGHGGFAEVYHCRDTHLQRELALKILIKDGANLLDEAQVAAAVEHPNIVPVYDTIRLEDGTPVIIYKYVAGQTLEDLMNKASYRRLPLDKNNLTIIQQMSAALVFAHGRGIVHRDIKPSNIIIDDDRRAYLTDFGLANIKQVDDGDSMLTEENQEKLGGTMPYMAPEQLLEKTSGTEVSDLHSLGVVVYEMLTGRLPYHGRDTQLIVNIANKDASPIPPTMANAELPPDLDAVLLKVLSYRPEDRYQTVSEFLRELESVTADYALRNTEYDAALTYIEHHNWREAMPILEKLPKTFKDVDLRLEQVSQKVRLLELYEKAESLVGQEKFTAALDTLETLQEVDPDYDITELYQEAVDGQVEKEKRTVAEQYQEAKRQFQEGKYQAALDTLNVVRQIQPEYEDPENIREQAEAYVKRQNNLRMLYNQGMTHSNNDEWEEALAAFTELKKAQEDYPGVDRQLATAQHFSELEQLHKQAAVERRTNNPAEAIDCLDKLIGKNANYKAAEISSMRQEMLEALDARSRKQLEKDQFAEALATIAQLKKRQSDYPGLDKLEAQAREGLRQQEVIADLTARYEAAQTLLTKDQFAEALSVWDVISVTSAEEDLEFFDDRNLVELALKGLYTQATAAILNNRPEEALAIWKQIAARDSGFTDTADVVSRANEQIEDADRLTAADKAEQERQETLKRTGIRAGLALAGIVIIGLFIASMVNGGGENATPTPDTIATQTAAELAAVPTKTPTETASPTPQPTMTATPTTTPTSAPTNTPTRTPSPTAEPVNVATARFNSSIFEQRNENSTELDFIDLGESVIVLDQQGAWIRVVNDEGVEGWAAANRFEITIGNPTATSTASITPTPSNTPGELTATTTSSASLFAGPDTNYNEQTFVDPGTRLTVLGRSANESWLFARTPSGQQGWVAVSLLNYAGDISDLSISSEIMTPESGGENPVATPVGQTDVPGLTFDFWDLNANCGDGNWTLNLYMEGRGGDGSYTYYVDGVQVAGPLSGSFTYEYAGMGTANPRITGRVVSGEGQSVEKILFATAPDCGG